ncbi:MAG: DUF1080 domain-containing protein, partial [Candidatus Poribacteria bacterium]|nr:DUF1080 domain-containing protein [Candidatus Poribacteria bacterium]
AAPTCPSFATYQGGASTAPTKSVHLNSHQAFKIGGAYNRIRLYEQHQQANGGFGFVSGFRQTPAATELCSLGGETVKYAMVGLMLFLTTASVWAGTFRDDFEDGDLDGWRQDFPPAEKPILWKVVDGELECTRQDSDSTVLITGDVTWTDYTIEFDVKLLEDFGPGDVDVIARHTNWRNHTMVFGFGDALGNPAAFMQRVELRGVSRQIKKQYNPLKLDRWHHFKLEAKGKNFTFWVNGEKVLDYEEPLAAFQAGTVGIGLANYTARFDNVEFCGPDVTDVTPPTWEARPVHPHGKLATTSGITGLTYVNDEFQFQISLPEHLDEFWLITDQEPDVALVMMEGLLEVLLVNVEELPEPTRLEDVADASLLVLSILLEGVKEESRKNLKIDGIDAIEVIYTIEGVTFLIQWHIIKDNILYIMLGTSLNPPPFPFEEFRSIVDTFRFLPLTQRVSVESSGKLVTTWAEMKKR